jgi:hypothetical protein
MTLQYQLDNLDGLDESISKLYVEKDGKFTLDVSGHDKPGDNDRIPLSRLNQEIEKRKASEAQLKELADQLIEDVPEDKRSIIPDLPPGAKISWLRTALKMGFFTDKETPPIDPKKPGDKAPKDFNGLSPQAIMAQGYKTK